MIDKRRPYNIEVGDVINVAPWQPGAGRWRTVTSVEVWEGLDGLDVTGVNVVDVYNDNAEEHHRYSCTDLVHVMTGRTEAVSEVLAVAILTNDDHVAEIISGTAEHLAERLTPKELDAAKARAMALVLEVGNVPEPGPVVS